MTILPRHELISRLDQKIDKDSSPAGCWVWIASTNANGYGTTWDGERSWLAHRLLYTLLVGEIPDGMLACHHCDNRRCVNPAHIFLGTDLDNMRDAIEKGRALKATGPANAKTKLTEADVADIRARYDSAPRKWGMLSALGREYGVGPTSIQRIVRREYWKHAA